MGFLFGGAKKNVETPKLPEPPPVPDPKVLEEAEREKMRQKKRAASSGNTMLTGSMGLSTQAPTQSKSLLGG